MRDGFGHGATDEVFDGSAGHRGELLVEADQAAVAIDEAEPHRRLGLDGGQKRQSFLRRPVRLA